MAINQTASSLTTALSLVNSSSAAAFASNTLSANTPINSVHASATTPATAMQSISAEQSAQARTNSTTHLLTLFGITNSTSPPEAATVPAIASTPITAVLPPIASTSITLNSTTLVSTLPPTNNTVTSAISNLTTEKAKEGSMQIGDCLLDFYQTNNNGTTTHFVMNTCTNQPASGYVKKNCTVAVNEKDSWNAFTLVKRYASHNIDTWERSDCHNPIKAGEPPRFEGITPKSISKCMKDYELPNANGTISHKIVNSCNKTRHGYISQGCSFYPAHKWNKFTLNGQDTHKLVVTYNLTECQNPVHQGRHITYESQFCPPKNPSLTHLPNLPRPQKITGGEDIATNDARHLVRVQISNGNKCTGTLLDDRHVLTAAHCIEAGFPSHYHYTDHLSVWHDPHPAKTGTQYAPSTSYKVKAGYIAPCYPRNGHAFMHCDLAVLQLEKPILNGQHVQLPTAADFCEFAQSLDDVLKTDKGYSRGVIFKYYDKNKPIWKDGNVLVQGFGKERNARGELVSANRAKQEKLVATKLEGNSTVIYAEERVRGGIACFGDSGGPLLYATKNGKKVQIGVTSASREPQNNPCGQGVAINYFTNVNAQHHNQWIHACMADNPSANTFALQISPDSCVTKKDQADDGSSWFVSLFKTSGRRRLTFINNCHGKDHSGIVNIHFQSEDGKTQNTEQIAVGETKVYHTTSWTPIKTVLAWKD